MVEFVPYNAEKHREQFFELNVAYFNYLNQLNLHSSGHKLLESPHEYVESVFQTFSSIKPPEGIIFLIMDEDRAVGMGALRKLEDGVGEVKRMFIQPDFQGKGYGKLMMVRLMDKARELGYRTLRLDTGRMLEAAVHVYKSAGFREIAKYPGTESHGGPGYIYMEKSL
jgi:GNAT superfamily N-acetyltransferase